MSANTANQELFLWCLRRRSTSSLWCSKQSSSQTQEHGAHHQPLMGRLQTLVVLYYKYWNLVILRDFRGTFWVRDWTHTRTIHLRKPTVKRMSLGMVQEKCSTWVFCSRTILLWCVLTDDAVEGNLQTNMEKLHNCWWKCTLLYCTPGDQSCLLVCIYNKALKHFWNYNLKVRG